MIKTIKFGAPEPLIEFCKTLQSYSPIESYLTPIPDILPSSPDFDACLGVIENEIMSLEDGTYFFGSTPVSALDFCTYLEKLE